MNIYKCVNIREVSFCKAKKIKYLVNNWLFTATITYIRSMRGDIQSQSFKFLKYFRDNRCKLMIYNRLYHALKAVYIQICSCKPLVFDF